MTAAPLHPWTRMNHALAIAVASAASVFCLGMVCSGTTAVAAPTTGIKLAPHRAVYEITLDRTSTGAGIARLTGRMVYELKGNACAGFEQTMRFVTKTQNGEGTTTVTDLRSSFWEDGEAKSFRFDSSQFRDEKLVETAAGQAKRTPGTTVRPEGDIAVDLKRPERKKVGFQTNALFPVQHSIAMLAAARSGVRLFSADLYDGSEKGAKLFATTAVIGNPIAAGVNPELPLVKSAKSLDGMAAWPVSLSYFDAKAGKDDSVPSYELAYLFYENGVSRKLFIDYGEFAIRGQLTDLVMLDEGKCDK